MKTLVIGYGNDSRNAADGVVSSREWVSFHGNFQTRQLAGRGTGSGALIPPNEKSGFDVNVPAVDLTIEGVAERSEETVGENHQLYGAGKTGGKGQTHATTCKAPVEIP